MSEKQFPVVCICGSTRFEKETKEMAEQLTLAGQIVLMVNAWSKKDALHEPQNPKDLETKTMLDAIHKQKIRMADYVLVVNIGGYWGKSTQSEIDYAVKLGKPVKYVECQCESCQKALSGVPV
jgi:ribosomal protein S15P/S13E